MLHDLSIASVYKTSYPVDVVPVDVWDSQYYQNIPHICLICKHPITMIYIYAVY